MKNIKLKKMIFIVLIIAMLIAGYTLYCKIYDIPWNLQGAANKSYIDGYNEETLSYGEDLLCKEELCFIDDGRYCFAVIECDNGEISVANFRVDKRKPPRYYSYSIAYGDSEGENDFLSLGWEIFEDNEDIEFACYFSENEKQNMQYKNTKAKSEKLSLSDGNTIYLYYVIIDKK